MDYREATGSELIAEMFVSIPMGALPESPGLQESGRFCRNQPFDGFSAASGAASFGLAVGFGFTIWLMAKEKVISGPHLSSPTRRTCALSVQIPGTGILVKLCSGMKILWWLLVNL